jgi:MFS family permease
MNRTPTRVFGREFTKLYTASAFSNLGDGISLAAFPLLAAAFTASPFELGIVIAARTFPWLVLSLPAGAIIDRHNPKRVMVAANGSRGLLLFAVCLLISAGRMSTNALVVIAAVIGSLEVFFDNSTQTILPRVVDKSALTAANGYQQTVEIVTNKFLGAPIGGFLMVWNPSVAFFAIGALYLGAAAIVALVRLLDAATPFQRQTSSVAEGLLAGVRYVWRHPVLRTMAVVTGLSNFAIQATEAVFVLFVTEALHAPDWMFGALLTAGAVGGIIGSMVAAPLKERLGEAGCLRLLLIARPMLLLITPMFMSIWVVGGVVFLSYVASGIWGPIAVSFRQAVVPPFVMGRANAFYRLLAWGSLPLGSLAGGWIAGFLGYSGNYVVFGVLLAIPWLMIPLVSAHRMMAARISASPESSIPKLGPGSSVAGAPTSSPHGTEDGSSLRAKPVSSDADLEAQVGPTVLE